MASLARESPPDRDARSPGSTAWPRPPAAPSTPPTYVPRGPSSAAMLYSPHAHAKIKSIDTSAAEKMPGVKAVIAIAKEGTTLRYHGDDIAAVAAETEEQARDAARAIKVEYEVLPHVVTEAQAMADGAPEVVKGGNVRKGRADHQGEARGRDGRGRRDDRGDLQRCRSSPTSASSRTA